MLAEMGRIPSPQSVVCDQASIYPYSTLASQWYTSPHFKYDHDASIIFLDVINQGKGSGPTTPTETWPGQLAIGRGCNSSNSSERSP